MKKINKSGVEKIAHGALKGSVYICCMEGMTAKEIAKKLKTTPHTIYSVANRMGVRPKSVYRLNKKFKHGELTTAIIDCCHKNMSAREIADKIGYSIDTVASIARSHGFVSSKAKASVSNPLIKCN
jgi:DNA-binding CsgD family transcriptional regulator